MTDEKIFDGNYYLLIRHGSKIISPKNGVIHRYYTKKSLCGAITLDLNDIKYMKQISKHSKLCKQCEYVFLTYSDLENMLK